jgi:hypothetical protein
MTVTLTLILKVPGLNLILIYLIHLMVFLSPARVQLYKGGPSNNRGQVLRYLSARQACIEWNEWLSQSVVN